MENNRILVVADDPKVAAAIDQGLRENQFIPEIAKDGRRGLEMAMSRNYGLVILEVDLPEISGYDICKAIRNDDGYTPVIMLADNGSIDHKITGFETGADDYVLKPFDFRELLARIRVFLKRRNDKPNTDSQLLRISDLVMNIETKSVTRAGKQLELTAKEFALLEFMIKHKGKVLSKKEIAEAVWGITFETGTNVIEVYINFLRKKMDKGFETKLIHTKPGMGYVLKANIG
ncbi:MAG: response regulator transcription factor [Saprospiraceae bacterium]|nr:response regulator transcription factor [Saprospiraceae bacterium]